MTKSRPPQSESKKVRELREALARATAEAERQAAEAARQANDNTQLLSQLGEMNDQVSFQSKIICGLVRRLHGEPIGIKNARPQTVDARRKSAG